MATIGVKVELEGAQSYKQSMSQMTSQTKLYQAEVKKLSENIKNGNNTFQNRIALGKALENQLKSQKEQEALLKDQIEKVAQAEGEDSQQCIKLKTQYENLQSAIAKTEQSIKDNGTSLNVVGEKMEILGSKVSALGDKLSDMGQKMSAALTVPLAAVGTASVKTAGDFESAMSQVAATMGYTVDELHDSGSDASKTLSDLTEFAKDMGESTAFSASESAEALNYMALAGYDAQTAMEMLPTVLNLAAAGGIDLASASDMVTDAASALGLTIDETSTMVDEMAKASSKSNTSVAQLGEAILTIGATAANVSGGTIELATSLGVLADNGIKGAEGGTHLRNMLLSLQDAAVDGAVDFGDFSIQVYDSEGNFRALSDIMIELQSNMEGMSNESKDAIVSGIFNKTDLASVNAMLGTSKDRFNELKSAIGDAEGSAQAMADVQLDNFNGQITLLKSAIEGVAITIGEKLTPYVQILVEKINNLVSWFNSLSDEQQDMIVKIGLLVAALGPALMVIGKIVSTVGSVISGIGALMPVISTIGTALTATIIPAIGGVIAAIAPFLPIIAAVGAAIAAVVLIVKNWGTITDWVSEKWQIFTDWIAPILESIKGFFQSCFDGINNIIQTIIGYITNYIQFQITVWMTIFNAIKTFITTIFTAIKTTVTNALTAIKTTFTNIFNAIKTFITTIFSTIKTTITTKLTAIKTTITEKLNAIKTTFTNLKDAALNWGRDMIQNFIDGILAKWESLKQTVSNVANSVKNFLGFSEPKEGPLSNFHTYGPDMMKSYAEGIENAKYLVEQAVSDVAMDVNSVLTNPLDYDEIYSAIKEGASSATTRIILNNREVTRALGSMGVVFNG